MALGDASCGLVARGAASLAHLAVVGAIIFEHEQTKGGRQVPAMPAAMNSRYDILYTRVVLCSDLLQSFPECIFKADTGSMTSDHDRSFDDWRFHLPLHLHLTLHFNSSAVSVQ